MRQIFSFFQSLQKIEKIFFLFFVVYFIGLMVYLFDCRTHFLWDFQVYYSAAKCYLLDLNPYDLNELSRAHANVAPLPYMYPPLVIYGFLPFAYFQIETATVIYLSLKILALGLLFYVWSKIYFEKKYTVVFLFFMLLSFNAAVHKDLFTGNLSIFEQLIIWIAIYYFLQEKIWKFALLIVLVATIKLLPILFLSFVLFSNSREKFKVLVISTLMFGGYLFLNFALEPELTMQYASSFFSNSIKEGGIANACSLEFFRSLIGKFNHQSSSMIAFICYVGFAGIISFFTYKKTIQLRKKNTLEARTYLVFILCLSLILIMPRFKDYSYVLAILPVFYILVKSYKNTGVLLLIALVCIGVNNVSIPIFKDVLDLLWAYYTLIIVFVSWLMFLQKSDGILIDRK